MQILSGTFHDYVWCRFVVSTFRAYREGVSMVTMICSGCREEIEVENLPHRCAAMANGYVMSFMLLGLPGMIITFCSAYQSRFEMLFFGVAFLAGFFILNSDLRKRHQQIDEEDRELTQRYMNHHPVQNAVMPRTDVQFLEDCWRLS